jgi:hypothetical protein
MGEASQSNRLKPSAPSGRRIGGKGRIALSVAAAVLLGMVACSNRQSSGVPPELQGKAPDGTVDMSQFQAAYIASASGGSGTLFYRGRSYPFQVGGLGVGGVGASTIEAAGEVYNLNNLAQFPGAYAQGRYGFVFGNLSGGDLWLKNEKGVIMHLKAKRTGLMLSLGGDAVYIQMNQ